MSVLAKRINQAPDIQIFSLCTMSEAWRATDSKLEGEVVIN
jgi:hypothetical protein